MHHLSLSRRERLLRLFPAAVLLLLALVPLRGAAADREERSYVGAKACESCHDEQYAGFLKNSNKAHSWKSLEKLLPKLNEAEKKQCYACHTTGYGKPGGFKSLESTPEMANVSCEACHGPGSAHIESGAPEDILRKPDVKSCVVCHNEERVNNFKFKPMLYHGGH
ncbi:MAG: cytochrome C [Desulfovibrionaceae bacterium]|nr:cytochrome C [Desulfovibrionaceae bacterium]